MPARFHLNPAALSAAPLDGAGHGLLTWGKDVLRCWPHEYDCETENALWAHDAWPSFLGRAANPVRDCSFEPYAMNYAFHALYHWIPRGTSRDGKAVLFDVRSTDDIVRKQQNFYRAMAYIKHYPVQRTEDLQRDLGCCYGIYTQQVIPTIHSIAERMNFMDLALRLWEFNHTETFLERVTFAVDGFPIQVCRSSNAFLTRLLLSGKYKVFCVKGELMIALGPGFPINYSGPHIGVKHDSPMWKEKQRLRAQLYKWEYGLGDKAYVGCREILTEFKGKTGLTTEENEWNLTLQHYRGRVEHLIAEIVQSRNALNTKWRGSFSLLAAILKICAHMVALQERMKGPRYDVFGPWPVCPDHIVDAYG